MSPIFGGTNSDTSFLPNIFIIAPDKFTIFVGSPVPILKTSPMVFLFSIVSDIMFITSLTYIRSLV